MSALLYLFNKLIVLHALPFLGNVLGSSIHSFEKDAMHAVLAHLSVRWKRMVTPP
jgi:hypothetical protein